MMFLREIACKLASDQDEEIRHVLVWGISESPNMSKHSTHFSSRISFKKNATLLCHL